MDGSGDYDAVMDGGADYGVIDGGDYDGVVVVIVMDRW